MTDGPDDDQMVHGYSFAVGDSVFCWWELDLAERNREFLRGLDTGFYRSMATMLQPHLDDADLQLSASIALRGAYHQGIESLMSLLGAMAQAPGAVPVWIGTCKTDQLKDVVERLRTGRRILTRHGLAQLTFAELAVRTHRYVWTDEPRHETAHRFAMFWRRLASEITNDSDRAEYNAPPWVGWRLGGLVS